MVPTQFLGLQIFEVARGFNYIFNGELVKAGVGIVGADSFAVIKYTLKVLPVLPRAGSGDKNVSS